MLGVSFDMNTWCGLTLAIGSVSVEADSGTGDPQGRERGTHLWLMNEQESASRDWAQTLQDFELVAVH